MRWNGRNGPGAFTLGPRGNKEIRFAIDPGQEFTPDDVRGAGPDLRIKVRTLFDGAIVGGMSYALDPSLKRPPRDRPVKRRRRLDELAEEISLLDLRGRNVESVKVTYIIVDIALTDSCDDDEDDDSHR